MILVLEAYDSARMEQIHVIAETVPPPTATTRSVMIVHSSHFQKGLPPDCEDCKKALEALRRP